MAVITKMPGKSIIDGFKGTLDFYVHCGVNCVRKWPRSPGHFRAPQVEAGWPAFAFSGTYWKHLPTEIQEAYNSMAIGQPVTGRELFTKSLISGETIKFVQS